MAKYNIAQAKARFSELVDKALAGEEVVIARDHKPLIQLVPLKKPKGRLKPGSAKGQILYISPDFDEPLDDFKDYM